VTDQTGAVVPDTTVTALNLDTTVQQTTKTNANGFFSFTTLPVGRYEIEILREGFKPYKRTGLIIDVNAALQEEEDKVISLQRERSAAPNVTKAELQRLSQLLESEAGPQLQPVGRLDLARRRRPHRLELDQRIPCLVSPGNANCSRAFSEIA